jgi:hypothetical protein
MNLNITLKRSDARSLRSQGAPGVWRGSAGACPTKLFLTFGVFPVGILILSASLLQAQLIDVDFNDNSYGADAGGPDLGPTMSGAAVLGLAGDQWNGIDVNNGTGIPLIYANGNNSPVTMTFTSGGGYDVYSYSGSTPFAGTPYDALMEDYLFNGGIPQTITLSGLAATSIYNLVLYNAADFPGTGRTTFFAINGNTQSSTWDGASSILIAGIDYMEFPSALSDASGNLVITYTGDDSAEGDVNGFQIAAAPVPEPQLSLWVFGLLAGMIIVRCRVRRANSSYIRCHSDACIPMKSANQNN